MASRAIDHHCSFLLATFVLNGPEEGCIILICTGVVSTDDFLVGNFLNNSVVMDDFFQTILSQIMYYTMAHHLLFHQGLITLLEKFCVFFRLDTLLFQYY